MRTPTGAPKAYGIAPQWAIEEPPESAYPLRDESGFYTSPIQISGRSQPQNGKLWQPFDMPSMAPWLQHRLALHGGVLAWGTAAKGADAANAGFGQLFNPTGNKSLIVLWKVKSDVLSTVRIETAQGSATGTPDFRDLRLTLGSLYNKPTGVLGTGIGTAPGTNNELVRLQAGQSEEVWATIAPGRGVNVWTTVVNLAINPNFLWIEVPAYREELLLST